MGISVCCLEKAGNQVGVSLIEVLVSISLLGIVTTVFITSSISMSRMLSNAETKSQAVLAAQEVLEPLRQEKPSNLPDTLTVQSPVEVDLNGRIYDVIITYCEEAQYCSSNVTGGLVGSRHIKAEVLYEGESYYEIETVFTEFSD